MPRGTIETGMGLRADRGKGIGDQARATAGVPAMCRGRRPIGDEAMLLLMAKHAAELIARGELPNDRAAARYVFDQATRPNPPWSMPAGQSREAIEDRLRSKFRKRRAELMAAVAASN